MGAEQQQNSLGNKISHQRKIKGFSQEQLAAASGISLRTIQRIERGNVNPQPYTLKKLTEVLEVDTLFLSESEMDDDESHLLPIRWMILSSIFLVTPILSNIIIPLLIRYVHRKKSNIQVLGSRIISMQILWLTTTIILVFLAPFISILLVGQSSPGRFQPVTFVYLLMVIINVILLITIAIQLNKGSSSLLNKIPKLL